MKMKIIISHDVDHLYRNDHYKDLIYPKLWIKDTLALFRLRGTISLREWYLRLAGTFQWERHRIRQVMQFDAENGVKSTFYFGMASGLGMSYKPSASKEITAQVKNAGFHVGVHGIEYQQPKEMTVEYERFNAINGYPPDGIRMHYVRFDKDTFSKLSVVGYKYDTTEFDKVKNGSRKPPYKVGNMWEFPLCIMDGYLPQKIEEAKTKTLEYIKEAEENGLPYLTILFHDYQFCEAYSERRDWYIWLIHYLKEKQYEFIDYLDAIKELESCDK